MLVPGAPVSTQDTVDAARIVLGMYQRDTYIAWRDTRWWDDEHLTAEVARARQYWEFGAYSYRTRFDTIFGLPVAQDILIAGLPFTPMQTISSLAQLGLHHDTSPDEDFGYAFDIMDRPAIFDPIRESRFPLSEVAVALKTVHQDRIVLMLAAGWTAHEVLAAAYDPALMPDLASLEVLAALRHPTS